MIFTEGTVGRNHLLKVRLENNIDSEIAVIVTPSQQGTSGQIMKEKILWEQEILDSLCGSSYTKKAFKPWNREIRKQKNKKLK